MDKDIKNSITNIINDTIDNILDEGISFNRTNRTVSYNVSNNDIVDTTIENNPTLDDTILPNIHIWSIFKRKRGTRLDGNPLIRALKNEDGWKFETEQDKLNIERQFNLIAEKFAKLYPIGISILIPSGNRLNYYIADVIKSKSKNVKILDDIVCKLTTDEVERIVMDDNSKFREYYKDQFEEAMAKLEKYLDKMDEQRNGKFTRHFIDDSEMRNVLDFTFKLSTDRYAEYANIINGQDILIIDDTISRGQSLKDVINIINTTYAPKSINVLTLMPKLY